MKRRAAVLIAATAVTVLAGAGTAVADSTVPFRDPNATGSLGFCDRNDKPVTSGNIDDVPFVWKVVSSEPVPKAYAVQGAKATLFAYSPLREVNPGEWTPYQMTAASTFTSGKHPMVGTTYLDSPMSWHVTGAPPRWDGLVQLRMLFSAPNRTPQTTPYSAAVIKVSGNTWTLVAGDRTPPCTSGDAVSVTRLVLPAKAIPALPPKWAANYKAAVALAKRTASQPSASAGATTPTPSAASGDATALAQPSATPVEAAATSATTRRTTEPRLPLIAVGLLSLVVVGAGIAAVVLWRRAERPS